MTSPILPEAEVEYPKDVLEAAEKACDLCGVTPFSDLRIFARQVARAAILAERERCAAIADHFSQASIHAEWSDDARGAAYYACGDVAAAIRKPSSVRPPIASLADDDTLPF